MSFHICYGTKHKINNNKMNVSIYANAQKFKFLMFVQKQKFASKFLFVLKSQSIS